MKRVGNLYPAIVSWPNLLRACYLAARGKRWRPDVAEFLYDYEFRLLRLQRQLTDRTYRPGAYHSFYVYEPKKRQISKAPFPDRVVHHALCNVLEPIFERRFLPDSYACRKGRGTHAAVDRCQYFARRYPYVLKADIRKCFPSMDHQVLKNLIARRIKDPDVLWLVATIIDGSNPQEPVNAWFPGDDLFTVQERRRGLPIGNQTSQFFANVYLDPLDHFIKDHLGLPGYARYVDDFVVFHNDKRRLTDARSEIKDFAASLRLKLHEDKSIVFPVAQGIPFLGYRVFPNHRLLGEANIKVMKRRLQKMQRAFAAAELPIEKITERIRCWIAHAEHADTFQLRGRLLGNFSFCKPAAGREQTNEDADGTVCQDRQNGPENFRAAARQRQE